LVKNAQPPRGSGAKDVEEKIMMDLNVEAARFMSVKVLRQRYSVQELKELKKFVEGKKEFRRLRRRIINVLSSST